MNEVDLKTMTIECQYCGQRVSVSLDRNNQDPEAYAERLKQLNTDKLSAEALLFIHNSPSFAARYRVAPHSGPNDKGECHLSSKLI